MRGGRRAVLGLLLGLVGCTDRVMLYDLRIDDGGTDLAPGKDGGTDLLSPSDGACGYWPAYPKYLQQSPELLILLDRSAAMQAPMVPGSASRQSLVESALMQSISTFQAKVKFGFEQFPPDVTDSNYGSCDSCCAGEVDPPVLWGSSAMRSALQCGDPPGSLCAPASYESASSAALAEARDLFRYPSWSGDNHNRYVLLVTASDPTCSPASDARQPCDSAKKAASDLVNQHVGIFLLSLGGVPSSKSCLAAIGDYGTPNAPSSANQVSTAVNEIVAMVARDSCTLVTAEPPIANAPLTVYFGKSTTIPQNDKDGWSFDDASRYTITLTGSWCQNFLESQATELHTSSYCSTCPGPDACSWVR